MSGDSLRLPGMPEGPAATPTDRVRDALAFTARRMDAECPEALDLEARALVALYDAIRGVAAQLAGPHWPEHWREALRGERSFTLHDVFRLATSPMREARTGIDAVLTILARQRGYRLEPADIDPNDPHRVLADLASAGGALQAELALDIEDGQLSPKEAMDLQPELRAERRALAQVEALAARAEAQGRTIRRPIAAKRGRVNA